MDRVYFLVNGKPQTVGGEVRSDVSLLDYLRVGIELRGTKYFCRQGGCGACVVTAERPGAPPQAVNSCLVSVTSCQDWVITTIEGIGSRLQGYHPVQRLLAKYNGTQCGYCSPGFVMTMYSLLQSRKDLTMLEIEKSLATNICRCTGYRPILDAFKNFGSDAPQPYNILDIEDLDTCRETGKSCRKSKCSESDWCIVKEEDVNEQQNIEIKLKDGKLWFRVQSVKEIFVILQRNRGIPYMLVAGNTAKGVYPIAEYPPVLIDISYVSELKGYRLDQNLVLGAGTTLTEAMDIFKQLAASEDNLWYLERLNQHLMLVAHIAVKNIGTIAGNLMIKYRHNEFKSDIFLLLEAVGAYLTIVDSSGFQIRVTPEAFLKVDMREKVILNVLLPLLSHDYEFVSFKVMPRAQNAAAIVNAGFLYRLSFPGNIVREARIVFGGLSPRFNHAAATEKFLIGRRLFTNETLQSAIRVLERELVVVKNPPDPSVEYRKNLAINLFYKGLLSLCPDRILGARIRSGRITLSRTRPVSKGLQVFTTEPALYPLNQPIQKVEALVQCSGEAQYSEDQPSLPREVFGAFVLARVPRGDIVDIDATDALHYPGVLGFYSAKDIPGTNSFFYNELVLPPAPPLLDEEVFSSGPIKFNGQVVGLVVAETRYIAEFATNLVHVKYKNVKEPVLDIKIAKTHPDRVKLIFESNGNNRGTDVFKVIKGDLSIYAQLHFCIETLVSLVKPTEEGLEVHCPTQWQDTVQVSTSRALRIPENRIDVYTRRAGGAYGLKLTRLTQAVVASALVALRMERPCRMLLPIQTYTKAIGKRFPCSTDYEVAVNSNGVIQYIDERLYMDNGYVISEPIYFNVLNMYNNCYDQTRWNFKVYNVITDTASNTWCRAPGSLEAIASVEFAMERIAYELSLDSLELRLRNLDPAYDELRGMVERVKKDGQYTKRRAAVHKYNARNRWKKRGLKFSLLRWTPELTQNYNVILSVYHNDGTISITHGGNEMGQGVNTKAVQIAAYLLGVPIEKVQIKANNTHVSPNATQSASSVTSLNVGVGVKRACEELLKRIAPVRANMEGATWEEVVKAAYRAGISLQSQGFVSTAETEAYNVYGVTLAEVEIDVLTGEWEVLRVDILEDVGQSVSPSIDVGQVEGAFTMGLGYWTTEELVYDPKTGELLTDRTWYYHVPQARDIPQDFRVYFRNNTYTESKFFGAKSIGEPPICMSVAVPLAMREAISSARLDAGIPTNQWFQIDGPYTREAIQLSTATKYSEFKFN